MEEIVKPDGSFNQTIDPIEGLLQCATLGLLNGVEFYYDKITDIKQDIKDRAMTYAARGGHRDIVELMITKGANDWNWALSWAASYGHIDIVKLMVEKGANDLNSAMMHTRHLDIIAFLIQKLQPTLIDYVGSETCSICYVQDTAGMCITKCNHAFHRGCLNLWVQEHISCPMCRGNL